MKNNNSSSDFIVNINYNWLWNLQPIGTILIGVNGTTRVHNIHFKIHDFWKENK